MLPVHHRPCLRSRALQAHYRIGMYSSASRKTVDTALQLLEAAAGPGPDAEAAQAAAAADGPLFERGLVLCRTHTMLASAAHVAAGGKEWDTVKPLRPYFSRMHRTILVDDDRCRGRGPARCLLFWAPACGMRMNG
jgi:hypothetical protein